MDGENNGKKPILLMDDLGGTTHHFRKPPYGTGFSSPFFSLSRRNLKKKRNRELRSPFHLKRLQQVGGDVFTRGLQRTYIKNGEMGNDMIFLRMRICFCYFVIWVKIN